MLKNFDKSSKIIQMWNVFACFLSLLIKKMTLFFFYEMSLLVFQSVASNFLFWYFTIKLFFQPFHKKYFLNDNFVLRCQNSVRFFYASANTISFKTERTFQNRTCSNAQKIIKNLGNYFWHQNTQKVNSETFCLK